MFYNLLHFKKVVDAGSISRASQLLFISQPALSKSIKTLEAYYGVELLERNRLGTNPTVYGELLYRTAAEMEQLFLESLSCVQNEKLKHLPTAAQQEVRIGCSMIWNDFLFPDVMKSLEGTDNLAIAITSDTSENLLNDLVKKNSYDFVLCRIIEGRKFSSLASIPLLRSQAAIFIDDHNPIFSDGIEPERLHELKWVKLRSLPVLKRRDLTSEGLALIPEDFLPPSISFEVEDLMAAIQLLRNNYIILLPLALAGLLEKYNIKPLPFSKDMTKEYWLGLVYQKKDKLPLAVDNLMNRIRLFFSYQN